jgi:hypothetical protein
MKVLDTILIMMVGCIYLSMLGGVVLVTREVWLRVSGLGL